MVVKQRFSPNLSLAKNSFFDFLSQIASNIPSKKSRHFLSHILYDSKITSVSELVLKTVPYLKVFSYFFKIINFTIINNKKSSTDI